MSYDPKENPFTAINASWEAADAAHRAAAHAAGKEVFSAEKLAELWVDPEHYSSDKAANVEWAQEKKILYYSREQVKTIAEYAALLRGEYGWVS